MLTSSLAAVTATVDTSDAISASDAGGGDISTKELILIVLATLGVLFIVLLLAAA